MDQTPSSSISPLSSGTSSFGKISVTCAVLSIIALVIFLLSGIVMPAFGEQAIVITQLLCTILMPLFALIGLGFGIAGIFHDTPNARAKTGTWLNVILLVLTVVALSVLSITSVEVNEDQGTQIDIDSLPIPTLEGGAAAGE